MGDNLPRIRHALEAALERSDLVVLCGGLGPTDDDTTREAIAAAVGEEPAIDPDLERELRDRFASFGRSMPERNLKQAWRIPSARALPNPVGTAPGWMVRLRRARRQRVVVALPGPPHELERMWRDEVVPRLRTPDATFAATTLKSHGLGESTVADRLGALTGAANPSVATYAKRDGVHVRVAAKAGDAGHARRLLAPAVSQVEAALGDHLWGRDDDELAARAVDALAARGLRLALAEIGTGGRLADLVSAADPGGTALTGAVVAWRPDAFARPSLDSDPPDADPSLPSPAPHPAPADASPAGLEARVHAAIRRARGLPADVVLFTGPFQRDAEPSPSEPRSARGARVTIGLVPGSPNGEPNDPATKASSHPATPADTGLEPETTTLRLPDHGEAWLRDRVAFATLHLLLRHLLRSPP